MRTWIIVIAVVLAACKKEAAKPDLSKMEPEAACRVIGKRAFECKDTITKRVSDQLTKAGASASMIDKITTKLGSPAVCEGVTREALDQMITCYDPDCGKLATCYQSIVEESLRPAGGDLGEPREHGTAAASGTASASGGGIASASGTGTGSGAAAAETFQLGNVMPDAWFAKDGGCARTIQRIAGCAKDQAFLDALSAGMTPEDATEASARAGAMAGWADANDACEQLVSMTYPEEGFLAERWDALVGEDLADCAKLGAAIHAAGGLPGGAMDD